ncbi:MAG: FeoB-associated Cys-rich membrane protein [Treponema sp.]|nr:FeoB-associated Cys-rich membrane protein [Treponema sp.]
MEHAGTIITGLVLLTIVAAIIFSIYRKRRKNKCNGCSCSCGCGKGNH